MTFPCVGVIFEVIKMIFRQFRAFSMNVSFTRRAWNCRIRSTDFIETYITYSTKIRLIIGRSIVNRLQLIGMLVKIQGVKREVNNLFNRNNIKRKNIFMALIAIPRGCRYIGSFAQSCTSQMITFFTFLTLNFGAIFGQNVTFMTCVHSTLTASPFKRFVTSKYLKLCFTQISAFEMVPFSAIVTRNAVTIFRNPSFASRAEVWHKL